ncbi:MAG TPA: chemotaxis protein CheX [Oligoflexia bacterium]|nr:chemotaxis protein CheX [Oligoflexia bacterium]
MNVEYINPFVDATTNVIETMAATRLTPGKPGAKIGTRTWGAVTGIIGMAGPKVVGNLLISFDQASIVAIVNRMLMENYTYISEQVVDAVGEITNMVSGGAKAKLSDKGFAFEMATPLVMVGKDVEITQLTKAPVISLPFRTPEGKFVVEVTLADKP